MWDVRTWSRSVPYLVTAPHKNKSITQPRFITWEEGPWILNVRNWKPTKDPYYLSQEGEHFLIHGFLITSIHPLIRQEISPFEAMKAMLRWSKNLASIQRVSSYQRVSQCRTGLLIMTKSVDYHGVFRFFWKFFLFSMILPADSIRKFPSRCLSLHKKRILYSVFDDIEYF